MFISLEPSKMYMTQKGVIYETDTDGIVDVNDEEDVKFLTDNAGAKKVTKQQAAALDAKQ